MNDTVRRVIGMLVAAPVFMALLCGPAIAQNVVQPTLDRIRENGVIYVSHRESSIPFSYYHGDEVVGYSKELCDKVVVAIKERLNDQSLKVVLVPVSSNARLMALVTGMIDLECGSTTNTKIRQQTAAFSVTTFVTGIRAMVREDSGIKQLSDLDRKTIITTAGTTTERVVKSVFASRKMNVREKSGLSHADSYRQVAKKAADAFVIDDILLSGLMANSTDGIRMTILEENIGYEPYGIAMRRNDPEFKALVDSTLVGLMKSGEFETIYNKWFISPIPPYGVSLNVPMSGLLKEAVRVPTDAGI